MMNDSKSVDFPNLSGQLQIRDTRTNKEYTVIINDDGVIKALDFQKIRLNDEDKQGIKLYDPGYFNTAPVISRISYIDGNKGILRYRGYDIETLAEKSTFMEMAYLLIYGELPMEHQLEIWKSAVMRHTALPSSVQTAIDALPTDSHPMGSILTGLCALSTFHPEQNPAVVGNTIYKSKEIQNKQIARIIGKIPSLAALAYHRLSGRKAAEPNEGLDYAENFLYMLDAGQKIDYRPNPKLVRILDILFILHAEHEMNCSTAAVRHIASSGVDVFTSVVGAIGALYGPLHGGANEAVLNMLQSIGSIQQVPIFIEKVKNKEVKLFGFGHRVYKNFDPRAKIMRKLVDDVFELLGRDPLIDIAIELMNQARSDNYFIERKLYPNVDFFSGLVYRAMGFPSQFFTALFAIPRVTGYLAHWRESLTDPDTKIIRPQQVYKGEGHRTYVEINDRMTDDLLSDLKTSNAYKRRISGINWK